MPSVTAARARKIRSHTEFLKNFFGQAGSFAFSNPGRTLVPLRDDDDEFYNEEEDERIEKCNLESYLYKLDGFATRLFEHLSKVRPGTRFPILCFGSLEGHEITGDDGASILSDARYYVPVKQTDRFGTIRLVAAPATAAEVRFIEPDHLMLQC